MRIALLATMMSLAMFGQAARAQSRIDPFVLAILADNNTLLPFASFDGARWRKTWPEPVEDVDPKRLNSPERIPRAWWGGMPFQPLWEVIEAGGRRSRVRIVGSNWSGMGSSCSSNIGMKIDAPVKTYQAYRALAASRPGVIEPVMTVTPDSPELTRVRALLPGMFRRHFGRSEDTPTLLGLFKTSEVDGDYFYFEASRWPDSFMTGWLRHDAGGSSLVTVAIATGDRDGDGKGMEDFQPLGVIRHGDRRFWIGYVGGYAFAGLIVVDVRRNWTTTHVRVDYPGC
jgi:hypothetical protein